MNSDYPVLTFPSTQASPLSIRAKAFVFVDPLSQALFKKIKQVAPTNANVLVVGETGTGKELIARQIHSYSNRSTEQFAAINCGAFPEHLFEGELFGYEKGAFSGAVVARKGWFEAADRGTLFLDEIGDLPLALQVKLLRVLQEGEIVPLGGRKPIKINVRLIAATNVNLEDAVIAGRFREDLYYRLNVVSLPLVSLRDRPGDIVPLAEHFIKKYTERFGISITALSAEAKTALLGYAWPGNIRELENAIHRALITFQGDVIRVADLGIPAYQSFHVERRAPLSTSPTLQVTELPQEVINATSVLPVKLGFNEALKNLILDEINANGPNMLENVITTTIKTAYDYTNENQVRTSNVLGISRNVLRSHLKRLKMIQKPQRKAKLI